MTDNITIEELRTYVNEYSNLLNTKNESIDKIILLNKESGKYIKYCDKISLFFKDTLNDKEKQNIIYLRKYHDDIYLITNNIIKEYEGKEIED